MQVTWQNLKDHFATVGAVAHADVFSTPDGRSAGCGKVVFEDPASADAAIARLNETVLKGRHIFVREVCHAGFTAELVVGGTLLHHGYRTVRTPRVQPAVVGLRQGPKPCCRRRVKQQLPPGVATTRACSWTM